MLTGFQLWKLHLLLKWLNQHEDQRAVYGCEGRRFDTKKKKINQSYGISIENNLYNHLECPRKEKTAITISFKYINK